MNKFKCLKKIFTYFLFLLFNLNSLFNYLFIAIINCWNAFVCGYYISILLFLMIPMIFYVDDDGGDDVSNYSISKNVYVDEHIEMSMMNCMHSRNSFT